MRVSVKNTVINIATWVLVLLFFFPVFWMFLNGFKPEAVASSINPKLFFSPTLDGYQLALDRGMAAYMQNSFMASIAATVGCVLLAIPAAYALSLRRVKSVESTLSFFISTRFMPVAAVVLPLYMILKNLGGLDNIWVLAIVYMSINLAITVWMMRSFFLEVPFEIVEAARVDGAGLFREIVRVVLPIVLPGVAAAALICFIFSWNELLFARVLTGVVAGTAPVYLTGFVTSQGLFLAKVCAAAVVVSLPVLIAGFAAQDKLVQGLSLGAVK
jgi:sorbitol/mannitol transport system permease protein